MRKLAGLLAVILTACGGSDAPTTCEAACAADCRLVDGCLSMCNELAAAHTFEAPDLDACQECAANIFAVVCGDPVIEAQKRCLAPCGMWLPAGMSPASAEKVRECDRFCRLGTEPDSRIIGEDEACVCK